MLSSGDTDILDRAPVILSCRADNTQDFYQNISTSAEELNHVIGNYLYYSNTHVRLKSIRLYVA